LSTRSQPEILLALRFETMDAHVFKGYA